MLIFPNAKINLGLHILRKRADGYHDISTVMYPVKGLCDALEFVPSTSVDSFHTTGMAVPGAQEDNICLKALQLLRQTFEIPALTMYLHKAIPMGAGLGGGSADAAFFLTALNQHFNLRIDEDGMHQYAAKLGSDCSFFIRNIPSLAEGRGEVLSPVELSLKGKYIAIVHPGLHISTAEAYANMKPQLREKQIVDLLMDRPLESWKDLLVNDFEAYAFRKYPLLESLKREMYASGAAFAAMSGSGSAVFGIFRNMPDGSLRSRMRQSFVHVSQL